MGYETYALKDIGDIVSGATPKTSESENFGGNIAWITPADLSGYSEKYISYGARNLTQKGYDSCSTQLMPPGTVLFSSRAPIGYVAIAKNPVCTNQGFKSVVPKPWVNSEFLYYQLIYLRKTIQNMGSGTTFKEISATKFGSVQVIAPPLEEQERIVSRIEELFSQLDASVAELKTAKGRLKVYRQAVLKKAFDQCKEFVPLSSLGDLGRGKSKHRPRNDPALFEDGKYPFIQTGDVKAASKYITGCSKMYGPLGLQQSKLWPKGTLCITIAANIAETAFLGIDACFPDSVVGFTPQENVLPEYIRFFIESQKQRLWAFAPATAQKNINLDTLEKLMIPYCPVDEQQAIIRDTDSKITICDNIEQTIDTSLQQAEALRQSILKKAFEGVL